MGGISQAFKHWWFVELSHARPNAPSGHMQDSADSRQGWITHCVVIPDHLVGIPLETVIANYGS